MSLKQKKLLEELRSELIGKLHTQPFTIYSDEAIEELLRVQPKTIEALTKVKGFPANGKRVRCFGKAIIKIFNDEEAAIDLPAETNTKQMDAFKQDKGTAKSTYHPRTMIALAVVTTSVVMQLSSHAVSATKLSKVQEEVSFAMEKTSFMQESKEEAKEEWLTQQEQKVAEKLQAEEDHEKQIEDTIKEHEKSIVKKKKKAAAKVSKNLEEAVDTTMDASSNAENYAAELKKKAAKKLQKAKEAKAAEEADGTYTTYKIGDGGDSSVKTWMPHTKENGTSIFCTSSDQYKLQQSAYTGKHGIRMVDGRYCIAVGSHYAYEIGTKIDVVLENGTILQCILGDQKADKDTDSTNSYHLSDGSYVEFVVDRDSFDSAAKISGDASSIEGFEGKITELRVWE